jgi:hypothetical protein
MERMDIARLNAALPCTCGDPFIYHCFYALHGGQELQECFPFCDTPCPGSIELCECCDECTEYVHPLGKTPDWWAARRMPVSSS